MSNERICKVLARWDPEGDVWVATSQQVLGLAVSAPTDVALVEKLRLVVPDLLEANFGSINYDAFEIDYIRSTIETLRAA